MACFYVWGCSCMHIHVEARDQPRVSVIKSHHFVYWNKVFQGTQGLSLAEADSPINPRNLLFCLSSVMSTSTYCHTFPRILGVKHSSSCMYSKHFVCHLPNPRFLKCYSLYQTWSHHFVCFKTVSHDHWCFELMMLWTLNLQESFWLFLLNSAFAKAWFISNVWVWWVLINWFVWDGALSQASLELSV